MNFDRNTVIGFIVLALLFFGYFYYINKEQAATAKQKAFEDSLANSQKPKPDTVALKKDAAKADSMNRVASAAGYQKAATGTEQFITVENDVFKIAFSNKGGQPKAVELKKFSDADSNHVKLASTDFDKIDYLINTLGGNISLITELYFIPGDIVKNPDGSQSLSFTLSPDSAGPSVVHQFTVKKDDYMLDFNIQMNGADKLLTGGLLNLQWQYKAVKQEPDLKYERVNSQVGYRLDGEFDYHTIGRRSDKEFNDPVQWVGMRQRFFNTILVAKNSFTGGKIEWNTPNDSATVVQSTANLRLEAKGSNPSIPLSIFYGPADYRILKQYNMEMGKLVNLGQGIYAFVRPINKYIVLPVFDFLKKLVNNYGIAILLLTVFIRLLTSPLMYPGYKTSAQMKILRPDLAKLKEKFPDQQQYAMEQMKFMREAGVNQFAGCLPGLLQIPIFFALYSFFNAHVDLRNENFLWANDLSAYDSILNFGYIPVINSIYGSHVSLFTITACLTSFLISIYSMSMTPDQSNPVLKYMPYIFPVFLLFIFNGLPSALTWYYTVSNIITLGLQFVIQRYIINHDKLLAKIEENRKKPKTKSKWQERMEQMQEQQKRMKEMQQKSKR
jgi:YidC/Oxa1 family membrane protein insertase